MTNCPAPSRRSRERELIWDHVQTMRGHFTADDLLVSLGRHAKPVSRATVYRALELLMARGVVQRVQLGEGGALYELAKGRPPHAHLYCLGCGRLWDYPLAMLGQLPQQVLRNARFQTDHLLLRICGYCEPCRVRAEKRSRVGKSETAEGRATRI